MGSQPTHLTRGGGTIMTPLATLTLVALLRAPGVLGQQALDPNFAAQYHIQTDLGRKRKVFQIPNSHWTISEGGEQG